MSEEAVNKSEEGVYRGTKEIKEIIRCKGVGKAYWRGKEKLQVLDDLDLTVAEGSFEALMGPSGSGKSTLLAVVGGIERPTRGEVEVDGQIFSGLDEDRLAGFRGRSIGILFQSFHLIPTMTALENVAVPMELAGVADAFGRAETGLGGVGLGARLEHYPGQLSGGEQQRVAIARALVNEPEILLADEPTGNLDPDLTVEIMDRIASTATRGTTVIVATHELDLVARYGKRSVRLEGGRVTEDSPSGGAWR